MKLPLAVALFCYVTADSQVFKTLKEKENLERKLVAEWNSKNFLSALWREAQGILGNIKNNLNVSKPEWSTSEGLKGILALLEARDSVMSEELKKQKSINSTLIRSPEAAKLQQYHIESHAGRIPSEFNDYLNDNWDRALTCFDDGLKHEISTLRDQIATIKGTIQNLQNDLNSISTKNSTLLEKVIESTAFHLNLKMDVLTEQLKAQFMAFDSSYLDHASGVLQECEKEK